MMDSGLEKRLTAALVAFAGGFLRNPVRRQHVTCAVCTTPVEERYSLCFPCKQHRLHSGTADRVAPVTYAIAAQQSGYIMRGYKARPRVDAHYRLVGMLTVLALSKHAGCAETMADSPITHWASIPSLPARPGEHPFHRIVSGSAPGTGSTPRQGHRMRVRSMQSISPWTWLCLRGPMYFSWTTLGRGADTPNLRPCRCDKLERVKSRPSWRPAGSRGSSRTTRSSWTGCPTSTRTSAHGPAAPALADHVFPLDNDACAAPPEVPTQGLVQRRPTRGRAVGRVPL